MPDVVCTVCTPFTCGSGSGGTGSGGTSTCAFPTLALAGPGSTSGTVGTPYSYAATASGGTAPYTYAVNGGALPTGLTLNASTGAITGTPTAAGRFAVTLQATDAVGAVGLVDVTFTIVVVTPTPPDITGGP